MPMLGIVLKLSSAKNGSFPNRDQQDKKKDGSRHSGFLLIRFTFH